MVQAAIVARPVLSRHPNSDWRHDLGLRITADHRATNRGQVRARSLMSEIAGTILFFFSLFFTNALCWGFPQSRKYQPEDPGGAKTSESLHANLDRMRGLVSVPERNPTEMPGAPVAQRLAIRSWGSARECLGPDHGSISLSGKAPSVYIHPATKPTT